MGKGIVKLGEGNWAVKDGNLLAAKETNGRFKNAEFAVTRGSDATYVGRDGLIKRFLTGNETELITNGNFSTSGDVTTSSFSLGWKISVSDNLGVSIVNNQLLLSRPVGENTDYGRVYATNGINSINVKPVNHEGRRFKLEFEIVAKTGTPTLRWYNNGFITFNDTTLGKKTIYFTSSTNRLVVFLQEHEGSSITLDNISLVDVEDVDGTPRIDFTDNTDGHLLLEPQSTNLFTYSEDFSDSSWSENLGTVTLTSEVAPDGTTNSVFNYVGSNSNLFTQTQASGVEYTISFFVKSNNQSKDNFQLRLGGSSMRSEVFTATSEWVRYSYTNTPTSSIFSITSDGANDVDILIWGAQLEALSYPTSYIPTNGGQVTRDAETCTGAGEAADFNSEEGVLYAEIARSTVHNDYELLSISPTNNSDGTHYASLGYNNTDNKLWIRAKIGDTVAIASIGEVDTVLNQFYKIAIKYKSGENAIYVDGEKLINTDITDGSEATTFTPTQNTISDLEFRHWDANNSFYGKVKAIRVYKEALSDTDLQNLTSL